MSEPISNEFVSGDRSWACLIFIEEHKARRGAFYEREPEQLVFLSRHIFRCPFIKEAQKHRDRANEVPGFEVSLKRLHASGTTPAALLWWWMVFVFTSSSLLITPAGDRVWEAKLRKLKVARTHNLILVAARIPHPYNRVYRCNYFNKELWDCDAFLSLYMYLYSNCINLLHSFPRLINDRRAGEDLYIAIHAFYRCNIFHRIFAFAPGLLGNI